MWSESNAKIVESCYPKSSIHFTSWLKQSHSVCTTHFFIGKITAVRMLMDFILPRFDDKDVHIPSPLIMITSTALRHALLEWQKNKLVHPKASKSSQM
jgi:hypothetical protein